MEKFWVFRGIDIGEGVCIIGVGCWGSCCSKSFVGEYIRIRR